MNTKLNAAIISKLIKEELASIHRQVMSNSYGFKPVSKLSLDWYEQGFSVYYKGEGIEIEVEYRCDTYEKDLKSGECILEITNIELECFNVDTESNSFCSLKDSNDKDLLLVGTELITNGSQYKLIDKCYITTDNVDETYSEMSRNYERYGY